MVANTDPDPDLHLIDINSILRALYRCKGLAGGVSRRNNCGFSVWITHEHVSKV